MFKNYLRIAFRNLFRNKSYVLINTLGLGIALACCITSYLIVAYNFEFDEFHSEEKVRNIYRLHSHLSPREGESFQLAKVPFTVGPAAAQEVAGIERFVRFIHWNGYMRAGDTAFGENITFVDSTFFSMFDFPLRVGSHKALKDKYSIFLTEGMARKYFGTEEAVGKTLTINFPNDKEVHAVVGGVFKPYPVNNTFVFRAVMRIENFVDINDLNENNWNDWRQPTTFVEVVPGADINKISRQVSKFVRLQNEVRTDGVTVKEYRLEHFKSYFAEDDVQESNINMRTSLLPVVVFVSMALVILLIACFNLTNTSIALTSKRLKEVGIRKAIGAARRQIICQFLFETFIMISLAMIAGLLFSQLLVPTFIEMWHLHYDMSQLDSMNLVVTLLCLVFFASLLAGSYPAFFQSGFKPISLLKGGVKIEGSNFLTRSLVAVQFALSIVVLTAGVMFLLNTKFQEQIEFGYNRDNVLLVQVQSEKEYKTLQSQVQSNPKIEQIAVTGHHVAFDNYEFPVLVDTSRYQTRLMGVGRDYCEVMGFRFLAGRSFNMDSQSDLDEGIIVNKAFVEKVGLVNPLDQVVFVHEKKKHIIGVIDNHVDNPFRTKEPEPFVFYAAVPEALRVVLIKVRDKEDITDVQKSAEKIWKSLYPAKPFMSQVQGDMVMNDLRHVNGNMQKIFLFLTLLAGVLSVSGIYSLAALNIAKRTKEIGIRKVLGASIRNVLLLMNREFLIILSCAGALGGVGGYYATTKLMDSIYAYHITIGILPVLLCGLAVFAAGIITTSSTIYKAAKANPVDSLKNE
jgi:putative ABC transport system permease protein